ncbi:TniQ family protein [Aliikangiella coralliicola]|uniref:TniQ family protein n=1 Tax=Aliikangiella coralliicola TaxID=2592383 RepID=A0A545UDX5_9GAMM|nr:TniQ family protein [Aliikangiella coralliicola]TQV87664.1 TniQ family protein [Aliikangiella coralliicola]
MARHKLFPIPLLGQGTAEVESLPSYLLRSAYSHGTSIGILTMVIQKLVADKNPPNYRALGGSSGVETLSRVNRYTLLLRDYLTSLTGQDMSCKPLDFLHCMAYGISSEISGLRWCPECLEEMERLRSPIYFKQLWHMTTIHNCPIHRTPLIRNCWRCDSHQNSFKAAHPTGRCVECGATLFRRKVPLTQNDVRPSWQGISFDLIEIFERAARLDNTEYSYDKTIRFVRSLISPVAIEFHERDIIGRKLNHLFCEFNHKHPMFWRLTSLRRLAYFLNMSLFDLLSANKNGYRLSFPISDISEIPPQLRPRKKVKHNHKKIYQKLLSLLDKQKYPPSLKQLARMTKVSVGYLEYRFPSLVRKVVDEHQSCKHHQYLVRRYRAQTAALRFFIDERYASYNQSRKEAYRVLSKETRLPKWMLKDAIQIAYRTLN